MGFGFREDTEHLPWYLRFKGLITCLLLAAFFAIGVVLGCVYEEMDVTSAIYVMVQIVTTVGYGDITPVNDVIRMYMAFYVLFTFLCIASLFDEFTSFLSVKASDFEHQLWQEQEEKQRSGQKGPPKPSLSKELHIRELLVTFFLFAGAVAFGTIFFAINEDCSCSYGLTAVKNCIDTGPDYNCKATDAATKNFLEAFYMSIITLTTVGFGDFAPVTKRGRLIGIFWMFFGVFFAANFMGYLSVTISAFRKKKKSENFRTGTLLSQMDKDGNGQVTPAEFLEYMLLKRNMIEQKHIDQILLLFDSIDTDGDGMLTHDEIEEHFAHDETKN